MLGAAGVHGVDPATCLAGTDLTVADIEDSATEVQAGQELRILRNILAHLDDSHNFARDVGLRYNFANMGVLGYALLASPTIGDAINAACRYAALSSTFLRLTRHDSDAGAVIEFDNSHVPADVREFLLERDMYAVTNLAPLLIGQLESDVVLRVEVPGFELPLDKLEFPRLTIDIDTSSARTAVVIPADVLTLGMPAADAATAQACVRQCEDLLQARRQRRGTAALVRTRLIRDPGQLPSMAQIAREFCITERTLHRRLAAEHTSYRALVDEVGVTLASALLESGLTVEETARQLGYSETAAFTRAFIRWAGEPPSKRRRR
jgi:AraC-like DNA-binding protein